MRARCFTFAILTTVLVLGLAACSDGEGPSGDAAAPATGSSVSTHAAAGEGTARPAGPAIALPSTTTIIDALLDHAPSEATRYRYAAALHARDVGRSDEAIRVFGEVAGSDHPLASMARLRLAQVLAKSELDAEAVAAFGVAITDEGLPTSLQLVARQEAAAALLRLDREADAIALLEAVSPDIGASATETARARWRTATIRRDAGDPTWLDDARSTIDAAPGSSFAGQALDALEEAGASFNVLSGAYVRYLARDNEAAERLFRAVLDLDPTPAEQANAWFYLGALAERAGESRAALDAYASSLSVSPAGFYADHARYWRGRVLEELEQPLAAIAEYDALIDEHPTSRHRADALMRSALARSEVGDAVGALDRLELIAASGDASMRASAARWHAVLREYHELETFRPALDVSGLRPGSIGVLLAQAGGTATQPLPEVAWAEPIAREDNWEAVDTWLRTSFGPRPVSSSLLDGKTYGLAMELAYAGEPAVARSLLHGLARSQSATAHDLADLAREAARHELHDVALVAASRLIDLPGSSRLTAPRAIAQLAYPAPYDGAVMQAAEEQGVPPLLLLALVRQESIFNPVAGSHAGALGLTQVIPPTGEAIARALGEPWDVDRLFEPETSLRYGAFYLAENLRTFEGNVLAALAAYNAGPGSARRWLNNQRFPGADGYIHTIEYAETKLYVESVLEHYGWYRYLYAGAPTPSIR